MPPRTRNSAVTRMKRGAVAATRSSSICPVTASWKAPWSRNDHRYNFSDFSSTQVLSGTYSTCTVAKSGWPVLGHRQVNSGQRMRTV